MVCFDNPTTLINEKPSRKFVRKSIVLELSLKVLVNGMLIVLKIWAIDKVDFRFLHDVDGYAFVNKAFLRFVHAEGKGHYFEVILVLLFHELQFSLKLASCSFIGHVRDVHDQGDGTDQVLKVQSLSVHFPSSQIKERIIVIDPHCRAETRGQSSHFDLSDSFRVPARFRTIAPHVSRVGQALVLLRRALTLIELVLFVESVFGANVNAELVHEDRI